MKGRLSCAGAGVWVATPKNQLSHCVFGCAQAGVDAKNGEGTWTCCVVANSKRVAAASTNAYMFRYFCKHSQQNAAQLSLPCEHL